MIRAVIMITAVICCCALYFQRDFLPVSAANGYIYEEGDTVTFKITQKIGTFYKDTMSIYPNFTMKDTIPAGLSYVSGSVVDSTGANYGAPTYNQSTREVSFTRPASWLASEANYKGQTFTMTINCRALQPQTTADVIKNIAYTNIGSLSYASNQVSLSVVKPDLSITKISDKNVYHSGETSKWTVTVTQPIADATADNVIIAEENLPAGLVIDMSTVKASDTAAAVEKGTNSFKVTVPHLAGGKSVTVSFNASFDADKLKSSSVVNTAAAASATGSTNISKKAAKEISVKNSVTTEIENGSITGAMKDIEIGGERTVEYAPDEGYYIQKVIIDGEEINAEDPYEGSYTFSDIRKNHSIRVVCGLIPKIEIIKETDKEQYHSGETVKYCIKARQTVEGTVAKNIVITDEDLPEGLIIDMDSVRLDDEAAGNGAELEKGENSFKVTIPEMDDEKTVAVAFDASFDARKLAGSDVKNTAGLAADTDGVKENKKAESGITVKNRISTEAENGTITESIEDIEIGGERTVEYAPDEGYYLQKVIADGEEVDTEEYKESYTFREICENHEIEVKFIPIPALAVTKETQSTRMQSADTMGYTIRTTQTVEGAVAENVEITDTNLPEGLVIDMDTIRVNDEAATIEKGENEFTVHVPEIDDEKEVEITFDTGIDIETLEAGAVNNTVLVRCSTGGEEITAEDEREIEVLNKITTKVQNGSITESIDDIRIGETHIIEYKPDEGYCLQRILVDGKEIEHAACENAYIFSNIRESHDIEVVYRPAETVSDEQHKTTGTYIEEKAAGTGDGFKPFCLVMMAALVLIIICGICLLARVEKDK